jgi:hypothetical protein
MFVALDGLASEARLHAMARQLASVYRCDKTLFFEIAGSTDHLEPDDKERLWSSWRVHLAPFQVTGR